MAAEALEETTFEAKSVTLLESWKHIHIFGGFFLESMRGGGESLLIKTEEKIMKMVHERFPDQKAG